MIIGMSKLPASANGALMADLAADGAITPEYTLDEQGVADILRLDDGRTIVCGCDATDDWTAGSIYIRSAEGEWAKKRTLENVLHVWGACVHNGLLTVATGAHIGDNATWEARCYISDDWGDTWQHHAVCYYRIYDIISFGGLLYATAYDWPSYRLYVSADDGVTWSVVEGILPEPRIRMVEFDGHLVGACGVTHINYPGIWAIDSDGIISTSVWSIGDDIDHPTLENKPGIYNFNSLVVAGGALYVLATSKIWKLTAVGGEWVYHCDLGQDCVGIGYFSGVGLIVSTKGAGAQIMRVAL